MRRLLILILLVVMLVSYPAMGKELYKGESPSEDILTYNLKNGDGINPFDPKGIHSVKYIGKHYSKERNITTFYFQIHYTGGHIPFEALTIGIDLIPLDNGYWIAEASGAKYPSIIYTQPNK